MTSLKLVTDTSAATSIPNPNPNLFITLAQTNTPFAAKNKHTASVVAFQGRK